MERKVRGGRSLREVGGNGLLRIQNIGRKDENTKRKNLEERKLP